VKEEVTRINRLVAEGRLSPEDAADLIDAFYASEKTVSESAEAKSETPPPPPNGTASVRDSFKGLFESLEKMTKEGVESINWQEVANHARENAKKGIGAIKGGFEDISKGKVHIGWFGNQETRELTLPLSMGRGRLLRIENAIGNIKVVGGFDVGSVTATAKFKAGSTEEAKAKARDYTLIMEESDHMVLIRQPDVSGLSVELNIQMPGTGTVEVRSDSGEIEILDTKGGARINSRSGDVKLRGLVGPVDISAESGNVDVEDVVSPNLSIESKSGNLNVSRVRGNVNARAASGNIELLDCGGKIYALETVSGNIKLVLVDPVNGSVSVRTVSGNSEVTAPEDSDCRVSLSTLRGSVSSNIGIRDEARTASRLTGRLGEGTGTLDISAVTGEISLALIGTPVTA